MEYKTTIGLEVHSELITDSKLFCPCANNPNEEDVNSLICPICMGYPGAMPSINKKAIKHILKIGLALGGEITDITQFDRKHYFYPDIPKGYQISQHEHPLIKNCKLGDVDIERIHLEEDTAKNIHNLIPNRSALNYNRSGVPLMELVTKPVIKDEKEAVNFAEKLQQTIIALKIGNARLEHGEMRVEANISISKTDKFGTKVEVKNLNSFKALRKAILYEVERQKELLENGQEVVQETRGWDEVGEKTVSQRKKETSAEYGYMQEPDLTKFQISKIDDFNIEEIKKTIGELPLQKEKRYKDIGLNEKQINILLKNTDKSVLFDETIKGLKGNQIKLVINYITTDLMQYENIDNIDGSNLRKIIEMIDKGDLSSRGVKDLLKILVKDGGDVFEIAKEHKLIQISDDTALLKSINIVVENNQDVVREYKSGKDSVLKFLIGQVMKETKGSGNPKKIEELLKNKLSN